MDRSRNVVGALQRDRSSSEYAPYPELANPGPKWLVRNSLDRPWLPSPGVTDMTQRVVYAPLRADGVGVGTHEMGHVLFSPPRLPRVRFPAIVLHAVEDARVNLALHRGGMPMALDAERLARVRLLGIHDLKAGHVEAFLLRTVASLGTAAAEPLLDELAGAPPPLEAWARACVARVESRLETARLRAGTPAAPFRVGLKLARQLARELARRGLLDPALKMPELACCVAVPEEDEDGEHLGRRRRWLRRLRDDPHERDPGRAGVQPGELRVCEAPLPLGRPPGARPVGRRERPASEGCHVTRPHRWALDGAIFRRSVAWRGGTVLIDCSGSMRLEPEQVRELVDASGGAALVALYSGLATRGELRVVARGGRCAGPGAYERFGGGNVVDLPALEWLARQPEPRLWISDGGVTGEHDQSSPEIRARCATVVRRGRIDRVASAEEAVRRLAAGGSAG